MESRWSRRLVVFVCSSLTFGFAVVAGPAALRAAPTPVNRGLSYVPVTPSRLFDSRPGSPTVDTLGAGSGRIGAGGVVEVQVTGRAGIPTAGVGGVVLNVTATGASEATFVSVWPSGSGLPVASVVNPDAGLSTVAALTVVRPGVGGRVSVFNDAGSTDVVVDVVGWFPAGPGFGSLPTPARLLDTRPGAVTVDGQLLGAGPFGVGESRRVRVTGRGGVPSSGVGAVILNVTAAASETTYLTVHPSGVVRPVASSVNPVPDHVVSNLVVSAVGEDGSVSVFNETGHADVIVDVVAWLPTGGVYNPLTPARVFDTRAGAATVDGRSVGGGKVVAGVPVRVPVAGRGGVPMGGVGSVAVNVTVTQSSEASWLVSYAAGTVRSGVSSVNPTPVTGVSAGMS